MIEVIVTRHALERFAERCPGLDPALLSSRAVQLAIQIGARFVRLGTGQRIVIKGSTVVSVMPSEHHARQVHRRGLGRYGKARTLSRGKAE